MPDIMFNGPEGRLEGRYHQGPEGAPLAIVLHPHPQHGGTMNNKVTYGLFHLFVNRGYSVLRFNFRGVGRSQGKFARGEGELSDAAAALDWLQSVNNSSVNCFVAGFSFGAWIAMQLLMRRPEIRSFVAVAPPANMYDFSFLAPCPASGLIVIGDQDEIVPPDAAKTLAAKLSRQRDVQVDFQTVEGAKHLFGGKVDDLMTVADAYIGNVSFAPIQPKSGGRRG
ncbi:MAG: alpha/beta fold hydrolase [Alphaproteobacteria bacterium]|nr:alpha/beta fold hydrolase [Alphaproteobacteria bacterium]